MTDIEERRRFTVSFLYPAFLEVFFFVFTEKKEEKKYFAIFLRIL